MFKFSANPIWRSPNLKCFCISIEISYQQNSNCFTQCFEGVRLSCSICNITGSCFPLQIEDAGRKTETHTIFDGYSTPPISCYLPVLASFAGYPTQRCRYCCCRLNCWKATENIYVSRQTGNTLISA